MSRLVDFITSKRFPVELKSGGSRQPDFLICPGDITNKGSVNGFRDGWSALKLLKSTLGAGPIIAVTGNHEVVSRVGVESDQSNNTEISIDPLHVLQKTTDYPSELLTEEQRWVYWGRGFVVVESGSRLFLLLNSSHYHWTTRANEFERGRIGENALNLLRQTIASLQSRNDLSCFIAVLHHHPIPHQDLDADLGNIEMLNGSRLIACLEDSAIPWLVIHGHKHHARLIPAQGGACKPIVFAAGTIGARLTGVLAAKTRPQFYAISIQSDRQSLGMKVSFRAFHWSGSDWSPTIRTDHGLPDGCGYNTHRSTLASIVDDLKTTITGHPFKTWSEALADVSDLRYLIPSELKALRHHFKTKSIQSVWPEDEWFPTQVSL